MSFSYQPSRFFKNGHINTVCASSPLRKLLVRQRALPLLADTQTTILDLPDNVRLQALINYPASAPSSSEKPIVIVLHGWEGCADSSYVLSITHQLLANHFTVVRLNMRDHGDTQHLNEGLFHSCRLQEMIHAIQRLQRKFDGARLYLCGFSLGGNFALRIGTYINDAQLAVDKIVAICPVIDPPNTLIAMEQTIKFYGKYFLRRWKHSLQKKSALFPHIYNYADIEPHTSLSELTAFLVTRYSEFKSLQEYLQGYALKAERLKKLACSASVLSAKDDPIIPYEDVQRLPQLPNLRVTITKYGGHCAYLTELNKPSWADWFIQQSFAAQ